MDEIAVLKQLVLDMLPWIAHRDQCPTPDWGTECTCGTSDVLQRALDAVNPTDVAPTPAEPGVHQHDYDIVERILVERIGARVKGRPREEQELTEEEKARFSELIGWAERRATVVLRSGTTAILVGVRPHGKAKVWYNAGHHTVPWDVIVGLASPHKIYPRH